MLIRKGNFSVRKNKAGGDPADFFVSGAEKSSTTRRCPQAGQVTSPHL
jgi:hypothetical protein